MKEIKKRLIFEVSLDKHKAIKIAAASLGMSMKEFIEESIKNFIKKKGNKKYEF